MKPQKEYPLLGKFATLKAVITSLKSNQEMCLNNAPHFIHSVLILSLKFNKHFLKPLLEGLNHFPFVYNMRKVYNMVLFNIYQYYLSRLFRNMPIPHTSVTSLHLYPTYCSIEQSQTYYYKHDFV